MLKSHKIIVFDYPLLQIGKAWFNIILEMRRIYLTGSISFS
jgi:hypothetical protein